MDIRNTDPFLKDTLDLVENIEFSDVKPKLEIKQEEQFKIENQEFWKSPIFDVKPKLEPVEASENGQVKIKTEPEEFFSNTCNSSFIEKNTFNSQLGTNRSTDMIIEFAENIEFLDNDVPKTEIKEEEGFKKENQQFDVKPKFEQVESSETAQAKIKTRPEKLFSNHQEETLNNKSLEIKDEFMWAMKDFVCNNVPPKNTSQHTAEIRNKKMPFECSLDDLNKHSAVVQEKKKPFECSMCPLKFTQKRYLTHHIADEHEKKKPFECSMCPLKFTQMRYLTLHIADGHEKKKSFGCSMCPSKFAQKGQLTKHIDAVHEKIKTFECSLRPIKFTKKSNFTEHIPTVHEKKNPYECSLCSYTFDRNNHLTQHIDAVHKKKAFECSFCINTFGSKYHLNKHIAALHEHEKPFDYPAFPSILKKHVGSVHEKFGRKRDLIKPISAAHK